MNPSPYNQPDVVAPAAQVNVTAEAPAAPTVVAPLVFATKAEAKEAFRAMCTELLKPDLTWEAAMRLLIGDARCVFGPGGRAL